MLALFYIFIAVAVALGIWQVNKLTSYRKNLKNDKNEDVVAIAKGRKSNSH